MLKLNSGWFVSDVNAGPRPCQARPRLQRYRCNDLQSPCSIELGVDAVGAPAMIMLD